MPEYDLVRIQQRHRTAAGWVAVNEVLGVAEFGVESDTGLVKVGDGVTPWNDRGYVAGPMDILVIDLVIDGGVP